MIDDAELDRAIMHHPVAILALDKAHRLADKRFAEIDLSAAPANGAVAMDPPHHRVSRVFGLTQDAVPTSWRQPVVFCRTGIAERGMRPLLIVDPLKGAEPLELLAQAAGRWVGGIAQQGQVEPLEPTVLLRFAGGNAFRPHALMTLTANRDSPPAPVDANGGPLSE